MAIHDDRQSFISVHHTDLVERCIEDGTLPPDQVKPFREFCDTVAAYSHYKFQVLVEGLEQRYRPFDPHRSRQSRGRVVTPDQQLEQAGRFIQTFQTALKSAYYMPLAESLWNEPSEERSPIDLHLEVEVEDFETILCCYRGSRKKALRFRRWFKKVQRPVYIFDQVVMLLHVKDEAHFKAKYKAKQVNPRRLRLQPGKVYLYLYRAIPQFDIRLLFPNVSIEMTWMDRLLVGIPAIGAVIPLVLRILPQTLLILSIVLFFLGVPSLVEWLQITEDSARNVLPVLVTAMTMAIAFGSLAFTQYIRFQHRKIRLQKRLTDTLLFKTVAQNQDVFQRLLAAAGEEESKEMILLYYLILTNDRPLTVRQLEERVKTWTQERLGSSVSLDIRDSLQKLAVIRRRSPIPSSALTIPGADPTATASTAATSAIAEEALFSYDSDGNCTVLPLDRARSLLQQV